MSSYLDLLDYRRRVAQIYQNVRDGGGQETWHEWVADRDALFGTHPQSPVEDHGSFTGLEYFQYDASWRLGGTLVPEPESSLEAEHSGDGSTRFVTVGSVEFTVEGQTHALDLLWLDAYGGGLFLPFRDLTNGKTTYGGGRYLLDTVKGADLGHEGRDIVLDFNYAYHPSCVHSTRWSCPLAPPNNRLDLAVTAGERISAVAGTR